MSADSPRNLAVRVSGVRRQRVEKFEETTGVKATKLAEYLIDAALDYFDKHQSITLPVTILPKKDYDKLCEFIKSLQDQPKEKKWTVLDEDRLSRLFDGLHGLQDRGSEYSSAPPKSRSGKGAA